MAKTMKKTAKKSSKKPTREEIRAEHREYTLESMSIAVLLRHLVNSDEEAILSLAELAMNFGLEPEELEELLTLATAGTMGAGITLTPTQLVDLTEIITSMPREPASEEVTGMLQHAQKLVVEVLGGGDADVVVALAGSMANALADAEEQDEDTDLDTFLASFHDTLEDAAKQAREVFGPDVKAATIVGVLDMLEDASEDEE